MGAWLPPHRRLSPQPEIRRPGLVDLLYRRFEGLGGIVAYETCAIDLIVNGDGSIAGVRARSPEGMVDIYASGGVVLACGGFEANIEMRVRYLGRFADSLILRGSRYNTGEGIRMAMDAGAQPAGQWGDYHSAVLDARSPKIECGVTALYNYQMGIFIDQSGHRFLDEGEDFRDHTYVKFSKFIVEQAGGEAWCLFDQKAYQREEFARAWRPVGPPLEANTLKEMAEKMGLPAENLMDTIANFNAAVQPGEYDLDRLDGKRTLGITPPKSNWALPLDTPPYVAIPVTGGITFTFGGLKCDTLARVIDTRGRVMPGLYAAGEPMRDLLLQRPGRQLGHPRRRLRAHCRPGRSSARGVARPSNPFPCLAAQPIYPTWLSSGSGVSATPRSCSPASPNSPATRVRPTGPSRWSSSLASASSPKLPTGSGGAPSRGSAAQAGCRPWPALRFRVRDGFRTEHQRKAA